MNIPSRPDPICEPYTASIAGDMSAPAINVDDGALLQGRLEIAGRRSAG
jgi:cytoskeletal protein CcmA (bactofilin family)